MSSTGPWHIEPYVCCGILPCLVREKHVEDESAYKFWQECGICCCYYPVHRVYPYTNKHIIGISGRTAGFVHQLTLHYSDGSSKTNGQADGSPVPIQEFDPAVDGHITKVEYDPSLSGGNHGRGTAAYLGVGYRFHLSGGRVITIAGSASHFVGGNTFPQRTARQSAPKPREIDGNTVSHAFVDIYWTTDTVWTRDTTGGMDDNGQYTNSQPRHFIWQLLPPQLPTQLPLQADTSQLPPQADTSQLELWTVLVDLDSLEMKRAEADLKHTIKRAVIAEKRSHSSGSFGWSGTVLWVDHGLRARFEVTLSRPIPDPHPAPIEGDTMERD